MRTTNQMREAWGPPCKATDIVARQLTPTAKVQIRRDCSEAFKALGYVFQAHNYHVNPRDTGGYNCRKITGGDKHSLHSYGIAVDVNWLRNPYHEKLITDMPEAMIRDILGIRTRGGIQVFRWGGHFKGMKDAMHFEVNCTPEELALGIDWVTVPTPHMDTSRPETFPVLQLDDEGELVKLLQRRLQHHGHAVSVDGDFGPRTETALKNFQIVHRLKVDGWAGPDTWRELFKDRLPDVVQPLKFMPQELELPTLEPDLTPAGLETPELVLDGGISQAEMAEKPKISTYEATNPTPVAMVKPKKVWQSKTFWVNGGTLVAVVAVAVIDFLLGVPEFKKAYPAIALVLPMANMYLRKITKRPVVMGDSEQLVAVPNHPEEE